MKRTIEQWRDCVPVAMGEMSKSAQVYAFADAQFDILYLHRQLEAAQAQAAILRRALNAQHAHHSESLNVFFENANGAPKSSISTDLGEAYQESDLAERTIKALTYSDQEAVAVQREFEERVKCRSSKGIWVCRADFPYNSEIAKKLGVSQILHPDAKNNVCPHCLTKMNVAMLI